MVNVRVEQGRSRRRRAARSRRPAARRSLCLATSPIDKTAAALADAALEALRPHRYPGQQRGAAARETYRRDEFCGMARGDGRHPRRHLSLRACLPAGAEEERRQHRQYRRHERTYRLERPRACHDGEVRAGRLFARARARSCRPTRSPRIAWCRALSTRRGRASAQKPAHHLTHGTITGERGKPEDVAAMVRFLCGPGGRYVTGQTIHVSGGAYLGS